MKEETFENRFKKVVKAKGLSWKDLAQATGYNPSTLCKWGSGRHQPTLLDLTNIAEYLNISIDYLMYGKEKK